jgi:hypothetical protein
LSATGFQWGGKRNARRRTDLGVLRDARSKEITASFVGVFHWEQAQRPLRRLDLLDVKGVVITQRANSPFAKLPETNADESQPQATDVRPHH